MLISHKAKPRGLLVLDWKLIVLKSIPPEETSGTPVTAVPEVHFTTFTSAGIPLATSAGRAVFPVTKQAAVVWRLKRGFRGAGREVKTIH